MKIDFRLLEPIAKVKANAEYKFCKPRLPVRIRTQTGPLLNLYKRKM
jgi:hypothetical protein